MSINPTNFAEQLRAEKRRLDLTRNLMQLPVFLKQKPFFEVPTVFAEYKDIIADETAKRVTKGRQSTKYKDGGVLIAARGKAAR